MDGPIWKQYWLISIYIYIYIYISATVPPGTPGRVRGIVWCLTVRFLTFKGVQGLLLALPFSIIFWVSFFDAFLEPNGLPQGAQNRSKSSKIVFQRPSWEHPPKSHQKWCNLGRLDMQSAHACAVQTHFFVFALRPEKWSKKPPKMEPRGTPNHKKSRKNGTQKNTKNCIQKVSNMTSKRDSFFVAERSPKSQKSEVSSKWAPRPPKWAPGPPKSLKIMRIW